jgi:hypothetical protein
MEDDVIPTLELAIEHGFGVTFSYTGLTRHVYPVRVGMLHSGRLALVAYQYAGQSMSSRDAMWKLFQLDCIEGVYINEDTFETINGYTLNDSRFQEVFIQRDH